MQPEEVWKANEEKTDFIKKFPGRVKRWEEAVGRRLEKVVPLAGDSEAVLLFEDRSFALARALDPELPRLLAGLEAARGDLQPSHPEAYRELDRLVGREKEFQRRARMEKILSAVRHNMPELPELKDALRRLLSEE